MFISRQTLKYQGRVLVEKAIIRPPYKHERVFQNEGCVLYMKGSGAKLLSSRDKLQIAPREAVLLKCDTYFVDFIKASEGENVEVVAIHLYPDFLKKIYNSELPGLIKKQGEEPKTTHIVDQLVIPQFIASFELYFQNPSLVNDDLLELKIKELVLLLVQTESVSSIIELIANLYSSHAATLREVIDLHVYSNLTVEELARLSHMSLSSFKRNFKSHYHDTPSNYINSKRIAKAKELLMLSGLPISDVAYEVGFNDPLYFTRLFKKKVGVPPSVYREGVIS